MTDTGPPPPRGAVERQPQTPLTTLHTTPPDPPAATCTVTPTQTTTKVGAGFDRESSFVQEDPAGSISMFFLEIRSVLVSTLFLLVRITTSTKTIKNKI